MECRVDVCDPQAIILFRLDQTLRIFEQDGRPSVPMLRKAETRSRAQISHTHGRGANASLGIKEIVKLEIEHGLLDATGEHIPSETDHLLHPGEGVDGVIELQV